MARRPRTVVPGVLYHITQRGNNRQQVFFSRADYRLYLDLLLRYAARFEARILGYCLMPNHVHLIAVPESVDALAKAMSCVWRTRGPGGPATSGRAASTPVRSTKSTRCGRCGTSN